MDWDLTQDWVEDELFEAIGNSSADIISLFWGLSEYFGENVCHIVAYSIGRILGERLYRLARKRGVTTLRSANELLVRAIKALKLARDAAAFSSRSDGGAIEVFFRVSSSAQVYGRDNRPLLFIVRGLLLQFYSMFASDEVKITTSNLSDVLKDCYEYVIEIPGQFSEEDSGRVIGEHGKRRRPSQEKV